MQGKLIIKKGEDKKLQSAAYFAGVKLGDFATVGDETHVDVAAKELGNIFKAGRMIDKVDGSELDAVKQAAAKKEAEKAKAAKK